MRMAKVVLIVEDEAGIAELVKIILENKRAVCSMSTPICG